jgi:DNA (cytosine-5)-methyltransferase 1
MVGDVGDIPLFLEYVAEFKPRFFLMDDLPDSFTALPMKAYMDLLPDYDLFPEWISNWAYGNIQKYRNRMFMVGALKSEKFVFRPGEVEHNLTTKDIIGDLIDSTGDGVTPNHANVDLNRVPGRFVNLRYLGDSANWAETIAYMREHKLRGSKPYFNLQGERKFRPGTIDPKWDGMCPVLSGGYNPFHPEAWRPMSVRERARIQGFPDDFIFYHNPGSPYDPVWEPYSGDGNRGVKQTGKAMPIQFCSYVMKQVAAHITKKPFKTSGARILKENIKISAAKYEFCKESGYADQERACKTCWKESTCDLAVTRST